MLPKRRWREKAVERMKIELKRWTPGDRAALSAIGNGVDRSFLSDRLPDPYTVADADQWLHSVMARDGKNGIFRAIVVDGQIVGTVSVDQKEDVYRKDADIGYFLVNGLWSRGIMTEAVRQACELAFAQLDIVRITGLVYADNMASRRVLEKNGFQAEGLMRDAIFKKGRLHDQCIYGKRKADSSR